MMVQLGRKELSLLGLLALGAVMAAAQNAPPAPRRVVEPLTRMVLLCPANWRVEVWHESPASGLMFDDAFRAGPGYGPYVPPEAVLAGDAAVDDPAHPPRCVEDKATRGIPPLPPGPRPRLEDGGVAPVPPSGGGGSVVQLLQPPPVPNGVWNFVPAPNGVGVPDGAGPTRPRPIDPGGDEGLCDVIQDPAVRVTCFMNLISPKPEPATKEAKHEGDPGVVRASKEEWPTIASAQFVLTPMQARIQNHPVRECGPDNHDGDCVDLSLPSLSYHLYSRKDACERMERVALCVDLMEGWEQKGFTPEFLAEHHVMQARWAPVGKVVVEDEETSGLGCGDDCYHWYVGGVGLPTEYAACAGSCDFFSLTQEGPAVLPFALEVACDDAHGGKACERPDGVVVKAGGVVVVKLPDAEWRSLTVESDEMGPPGAALLVSARRARALAKKYSGLDGQWWEMHGRFLVVYGTEAANE
jgi:hypothetical protein